MGEIASRSDVARLFARAAFGATATDLDLWTGQPYGTVVDHLLNIPDPALRPPAPDDAQRLVLQEGGRQTQVPLAITIASAQRWWVERMRTTLWPLEERMTLFWHDLFATGPGAPFPDVGLLMLQNQTLRLNALGNFKTMCEQVTLDPAMLYWLNGNESTNRRPNENFAREFFELFTLGTIPQIYTETDIRESARALTGWQVDPNTRAPAFSANRHDAGTKAVLGRTIANAGAQEYLQIVDVALAQAVAPLFIAHKMVTSFAYPPMDTTDPLVEQVAATLRTTGWNLREAMRTLLSSDTFRDAPSTEGRQIVRQPIDLVASACKAIGVTADAAQVPGLLTRMGQRPFDPPNVGGWPVGKEWLSPVTTLARYDWGVACHAIWNGANPLVRPALPGSGDLAGWTARFGLAELAANTTASIQSYLASRASATEAERQAGVLILLASSPDWMVM